MLDTVGPSEVNVVKTIKSITGLGLKEAKVIADRAPSAVKNAISAAEPATLETQLESAGASASVRCD